MAEKESFFILKIFFCVCVWTVFKVFFEFVAVLLLLGCFNFFCWKACGILALQPGMEPTPIALRDFKCWAIREDPGQTDFSVYEMVTFPKAEGNQFSK